MENILREVREEIKKSTEEENLNTSKLSDLIKIYQRLIGYQTTSVAQIQPINHIFYPDGYDDFPVLPPARNETATLYDGILKLFQDFYKKPDDSGIQIMRYIDWYRFIDEKETAYIDNACNNELSNKAVNIRIKLYEKILGEIEKELDKKDKQQEETQ